MHNAFTVVKMFEESLAEYTGAKYAVALNSGSSAIKLALKAWMLYKGMEDYDSVTIPSKTYRSVLLSSFEVGYNVEFENIPWTDTYQIKPTEVWDCALSLKGGMFKPGTIQCLSFHPQKQLALSSGGGAILHDRDEWDRWFRWQRWDGRQEGVAIQDDDIHSFGEHCYMFPSQAAEALHKLNILASRPLPPVYHPDYEDLSKKWRV